MSHYTIDERNLERQKLLAQILNPLTIPVVERIPREGVRRVLDLGCGQGHTSRMLAEQFPGAAVTGLEYDHALVAYASSNAPATVRFEQGNAASLPYEDASFDFVFTRYLLVHLPDPDATIREMLRVVRPGGFVMAYEPDCTVTVSYPPYDGLATSIYLWQKLFARPYMGRELNHRFRQCGARNLTTGGVTGVAPSGDGYGRIYRISFEALKEPAITKGLLTEAEFGSALESLRQLEADTEAMCVKFPDVWVIAAC